MDSQNTNQNGVDVVPEQREQNNSGSSAAKPAIKTSNSPRDKDSALTSPQKHREKRKHCDSADSDRHMHKKRKHSQDARFEGRRISHLVKKKTYKKAEGEDGTTENQKISDDYVLAKLFKKSGKQFSHKHHAALALFHKCTLTKQLTLVLFWSAGIHSVMQHDTIMESSNPDYVLVEAEANRVAKDALKALKASRQRCRLPYNKPPPPPAKYAI